MTKFKGGNSIMKVYFRTSSRNGEDEDSSVFLRRVGGRVDLVNGGRIPFGDNRPVAWLLHKRGTILMEPKSGCGFSPSVENLLVAGV